ncbi:MAG: prolipoprotein diacylglyceryl transferase [Acidimicrobiales bacterium]|jgi:phosphatidylglycerol:prolipoprotein diacylglycerol transferase
MKPIPVAFHIGPLLVHTYGIGLAITFWFAYRYFERRLRDRGYRVEWLTGVFIWVVVAAIVGARAMHVLANLSYYSAAPGQILQVWHGGLSSFGGLAAAVPTGVILARRRCPELPSWKAADIVTPVLVAAWGVGRLLGPQLMVAGGGHPTNQWFGMYYADQVGKRLPVPIFQAFDCFVILAVLILIERRWADRPTGFVFATGVSLWDLARFFEEHLWLAYPGHLGSTLVQIAGLALFAAGAIAAGLLWWRQKHTTGGEAPPVDGIGEPQPAEPQPAET